MATVRKDIPLRAPVAEVWDAIRDIGALHTRLVPGFVVDTRLEPGARIVTFANGMVVREPIVALDDAAMRLVWTAEGGHATHFNGAAQVVADGDVARVIWVSDFLPDAIAPEIEAAMTAGAAAMQRAFGCAME